MHDVENPSCIFDVSANGKAQRYPLFRWPPDDLTVVGVLRINLHQVADARPIPYRDRIPKPSAESRFFSFPIA